MYNAAACNGSKCQFNDKPIRVISKIAVTCMVVSCDNRHHRWHSNQSDYCNKIV